jgi:hypothetical protein
MRRISSTLRITIPIVLAAATTPLRPSHAQAPPCDPGVATLAQGDFGYRARDDRCEGVYAQKVGGTVLSLASLTESFEDYSPSSGRDLILQWRRYGGVEVRLQARTITQRLHYRMDALRPVGDSTYRWPSNVLGAQSIVRAELGVTAHVRQAVGGVERDVYLPLRIVQVRDSTPEAPASRQGAYDLVIYPVARLTQLFLTVASVGADGQPATYIKRDQELACQYCPADQPISIRVSGLGAPGVYFVEISARLAGGGSTAIQQWFYHAGWSKP